MVKKGSGDELVVFLTPVGDQVIEALADRYCVVVAADETPSATIEQCGFRRAHLISRGTAALELIDVPLLLLNANPFVTAMHNAVPMSQLITIDLDDPRALTRALWSHPLRVRSSRRRSQRRRSNDERRTTRRPTGLLRRWSRAAR